MELDTSGNNFRLKNLLLVLREGLVVGTTRSGMITEGVTRAGRSINFVF